MIITVTLGRSQEEVHKPHRDWHLRQVAKEMTLERRTICIVQCKHDWELQKLEDKKSLSKIRGKPTHFYNHARKHQLNHVEQAHAALRKLYYPQEYKKGRAYNTELYMYMYMYALASPTKDSEYSSTLKMHLIFLK